MASPESTKPTPKSPKVQDSPVFNYLSNLSPLKPPDARASALLYGDASCPTPEPVFTSPHFCRQPNLLKGSQQLGLSEMKKFHCDEASKLSERAHITPSLCQRTKLVRCNMEKCDSDDPLYDHQPCNSPSADFDTYLADPSENCDNPPCSPNPCLRQATETAKDVGTTNENQKMMGPIVDTVEASILPQNSMNTGEIIGDVNTCITTKASGSSNSLHQSGDRAGEEPSALVNLDENEGNVKIVDEAMKMNQRSLEVRMEPINKNASLNADSSSVTDPEAVLERSFVHQAVANCPSFLSKNGEMYEHPKNVISCYHSTVDGGMHQAKTVKWDESDCTLQSQSQSHQIFQECDCNLHDMGTICCTSGENHIPYGQEEDVQNQCGMRKRLQFGVSANCRITAECKTNPLVCEQNRGSHPVAVPKPFGIGLHLNSIGSIGAVNINVNIHLPENNVVSENCPPSRSLTGPQSVNLISNSDKSSPYSASGINEEKIYGNQAVKIPDPCASYQSSLDVKPLNSNLPLNSIDRYMTPCSMKRPSSEVASCTLSGQRSTKKKRKTPSDNDGRKRCNCKRSKCSKLYCDCFAAGSCCSAACSCLDCHNTPEHEGTLLETRQLIVSRNPLAFAPKVVVCATKLPKEVGDNEGMTPTSVRHKKGCNCKKSQCLKKYCECYQAGVGCSFGCRCEGCRNTFGMKDGCDEIIEIEHKKNNETIFEKDPYFGRLEGIEVKSGVDNSEHSYSRLSPLTPFFQGSSGNDATKGHIPAKHNPSPESGASISPSFEDSPSSPMDSISIIVKGRISSVLPDGFADIQASDVSASLKLVVPTSLPARLLQGNNRLSVGTPFGRCSPVTPLPRLGEGKFVIEPDSNSGLFNNQEDTPEILQDTCSPIKPVTSTSPNKKRVSPPHRHPDEAEPRFSPGLRSGRKFILQSVPSFPPLSPCNDNTRRRGT